MSDDLHFERMAPLDSVVKALQESGGAYVMTNRVFNLNVYDEDLQWLGIIGLTNVQMHDRLHEGEPWPDASWEPVGEEWR